MCREVAALPKNSLALTKRAWLKYGKKTKTDVFPPYRSRFKNLLKFCGTYSLGAGLPDWWPELLEELRNKAGYDYGWVWEDIVELFEKITPEEFRLGQFQAKRHKDFWRKLNQRQRRIISSPKIGKFLQEQFGICHRFTVAFNGRGAKYQEKEVVITADPWDIVNMAARGKSWSSCQDFTEHEDCEVWVNLRDPAMLIALVRTKNDGRKKNMDTRAILRYVWVDCKKTKVRPRRGVIIDKFYGDAAYIPAIQKTVLQLCKKHGLCLFEYTNGNTDHRMTSKLRDKFFYVCGPSINFPGDPLPYTEISSEWVGTENRKRFYHLRAQVRLIYDPLE